MINGFQFNVSQSAIDEVGERAVFRIKDGSPWEKDPLEAEDNDGRDDDL